MKKVLSIGLSFALLMLTGCQIIDTKKPTTPPIVVLPPSPPPYEPPPTPPVLPPPEIPINWMASVAPLVNNLINASAGMTSNNVLLFDQVKNNTSGQIATIEATQALKSTLASSGRFELVSENKLNEGRQALGLSSDDSLITRTKAMGLARYLGANYLIYATANGSANTPELALQLIQVTTGEIVWSGKGNAER